MAEKNPLGELFAKLETLPGDDEATKAATEAFRASFEPKPFATAPDAMRFILGGMATVTLQGRTSRFTYKITQVRDKETDAPQDAYFVGVLTGPDNTSNYRYLGMVRRGVFFHDRRERISKDAPSARAWSYSFGNLARGVMPAGLEVWHEGKCARCGHPLTDPESIKTGFGPICVGKIGGL